jgi:nicotinamide-nucleotide amidase
VISEDGSVSEQVVAAMALSVKDLLKTDYSIACSGIAGPTGGTADKPLGTVWIAIGTPTGVVTKKLQLGDNRERVIHETALHAMNLLRKQLL